MREENWEGPVVELSRPLTAYLLWLIARDLRGWDAERKSKLAREESVALAHFLTDFLPPDMRTPIEPLPLLRAG